MFTAVARLSTLGVWFFLTPAVLASLGAEKFGFWSILLILGGTVATIDLGLGVAVSRYAADLAGRGEIDEIPGLVLRALAAQLVVAAALFLVGLLARESLL